MDARTKTYRRIRKAIGIIGFSLPIVLFVLSYMHVSDTKVLPSISHYYYSNFREIFVGSLCGVGLFMIMYEGYHNPNFWKNDTLWTNIAGYSAIGISFFPTTREGDMLWVYTIIPIEESWVPVVHYIFGAVLFLSFAILSMGAFRIGGHRDEHARKASVNENTIYLYGGIIILICMLAAFLFGKFMPKAWPNSTFFFEWVMLSVFGFIWLIKGRFFGDTGRWGEWIYGEIHHKGEVK